MDEFDDLDEESDDEPDETGEIREYDPMRAPDPEAWLALDEDEQVELIANYHLTAGEEAPDNYLHALAHALIENQAAMGDELPVRRTIERLQREGLDRHEAIHAVGSVLMEQMFEAAQGNVRGDVNARYWRALKRLTAKRWLKGG